RAPRLRSIKPSSPRTAMRKHHLLESMLEFALLASVVGFGLGVLAVFFAASQIFEIHPKSARSAAKPEAAATAWARQSKDGRTLDNVSPGTGSIPQMRPLPATGQLPPGYLELVPRPAASQWPLVMVGVLAGLGVFLLALLAWVQVRSVLSLRPVLPNAAGTAAATTAGA